MKIERNVLGAAALTLLSSSSPGAQQPAVGSPYQATGRVIMEDRSRVPLTAAVELICNGQIRKRVSVYTNGDFRIGLGTDNSEMPEIVTPTDLFAGQKVPFDPRPVAGSTGSEVAQGRFDLSGCELRAVLPGYQSNQIALGPRRSLESPEVGQLVLHLLADGTAAGANTLAAPEKAGKAYEAAWKYLEKEKPDYASAVKALDKAIAEYPRFAAAWNLMGKTRLALKDDSGARDAFARSISADPRYVEPLIQLARLAAQQGRWSETVRWASQALRLTPSDSDANYFNALGNFQMDVFDAAEKSALELQKNFDLEQYPVTYYILGAIQARHGDFDSAATNLRLFLNTKPDAETAASVRKILDQWAEEDRGKK